MTDKYEEATSQSAVEHLINLVALAMTRNLRQVEAIALLDRSGLSNGRIAEILGTTPDSVRAERNRLKRAAPKKTKKSSDNEATGA